MTTIPSVSYATQARSAAISFKSEAPKTKSPEAFEGEAQLLKEIYYNYMQNIGGYQEINGHPVHVTTVLHINENAQKALKAIESRLIELGALQGIAKMPQIK